MKLASVCNLSSVGSVRVPAYDWDAIVSGIRKLKSEETVCTWREERNICQRIIYVISSNRPIARSPNFKNLTAHNFVFFSCPYISDSVLKFLLYRYLSKYGLGFGEHMPHGGCKVEGGGLADGGGH